MCSQTRNNCAKAFDNQSRSKNLKPKKSRGWGQFDPPPPPLKASRVNGVMLQHNMLVVRDMSQTMILRWDFFLEHKAKVDAGRQLFVFGGRETPLSQGSKWYPHQHLLEQGKELEIRKH